MKTRITALIIMLCVTFFSFAQGVNDYLEVVYLKNGTTVKGVIVEQVPGKSIKIRTAEGSEFVYGIGEIAKFGREMKAECKAGDKKACCAAKGGWADSHRKKVKGAFFEMSLLGGTGATGFRLTPGYKFGRMGYLGLAFGIEAVNLKRSFSSIPEISLNLIYAGDILDKRITPFYQLEIGYGYSLDRYGYNKGKFDFRKGGFFGKDIDGSYEDSDIKSTLNYGGPMGAIAFGVKFNTAKKVYFKLGLDARLTSNFADIHTISAGKKEVFTVNPGLGARFGIGF